MSKSIFEIETPKSCLHCDMRACLLINGKHYQLCGLQIPKYGYCSEAFFTDKDLKEDWISPECPLVNEKQHRIDKAIGVLEMVRYSWSDLVENEGQKISDYDALEQSINCLYDYKENICH